MNYIFAGLIIAAWIYLTMSLSWDPHASKAANLIIGLGCVLLLGLIYWLPFWLIFMK